jgi:quinol monooxygenase YgiN
VPKVIGDADMTKAASEAGRLVGTPAVVAVIEQYEDAEGYVCENVAQIKPEDRQSFLDELAKLTA